MQPEISVFCGFLRCAFCDVRVIRLAASDSHSMEEVESPGNIQQIVQRLQQIRVRDDLSSWMRKSCPDAGKGMLRLDADLAIVARLLLFNDEKVVLSGLQPASLRLAARKLAACSQEVSGL